MVPRFYFHIRNDMDVQDDEGLLLEDLEAVREVALESARGLICERVNEGHLNLDHYIEVADERGDVVLKLTYRDSFTIQG